MPSIIRRRAVTFIAAIAGVCLLATGCGNVQSAAVRVDGQAYSDADLRDELDAYGDNEELFGDPQASESIRGELAESYDQQFVGSILQQRITFMLGEQLFDDSGFELDEAQRDAANQQLAAQFGPAIDAFPKSFVQSYVDDVARLTALQDDLGPEDLNEALIKRAEAVDIDISSRYGSWDDEQLTVVPPDGPSVNSDAQDVPVGLPIG